MLLTYVDESYTKDRYYIAGLAVHHQDIRALENAITQIVADAAKAYADVRVTSENSRARVVPRQR